MQMRETDEQQKLRFQVELEFVQCLANPNYLNFLAQRGHFKDPAFINYIKYLQYWKETEYSKYLKYPMCLHFLDLLQYENFQRELVNKQCATFIDDQQLLHWQHYTRRRNRLLTQVDNQNSHPPNAPPAQNSQSHSVQPTPPHITPNHVTDSKSHLSPAHTTNGGGLPALIPKT